MNVVLEFFVVAFRVVWSFVLVAAKWIVKAREKNVAGQVCVITGAGGALGRILAKEFARRGATLVLWDVNKQSNEETAGMVREIHNDFISNNAVGGSLGTEREGSLIQPQVHTYVCDVGKRDQVYQTARKVQHEVGEVDILINNTGVVSGWHLLECPDQLIEHTLTVNCHALFWTSKAFLPRMLELNHGHIVTVASTLGLFSTAGIEDYCASKCGAVGFHESLSHELKALEKDGIKMTLVCPSLVDSDMFRGCRIRKEVAPPMSPEECVRRAMRAILTDEPMIYTPRSMYMVNFMKTVLPFDAMVCMYRFLGADKCMSPFLAHRSRVMNNNESQLDD